MDRCCKVICNLDGDVGRKLSNTSAYLMQIQGGGKYRLGVRIN